MMLQLGLIGQYTTSSSQNGGGLTFAIQPQKQIYHASECWFSMIEHHKIKKGLYGVSLNMTTDMLCVSRYYKMQGLFRALSDVARQANVTMVLGYGTLLSYHRYKDIMVSTIVSNEEEAVGIAFKCGKFSNMILHLWSSHGMRMATCTSLHQKWINCIT